MLVAIVAPFPRS